MENTNTQTQTPATTTVVLPTNSHTAHVPGQQKANNEVKERCVTYFVSKTMKAVYFMTWLDFGRMKDGAQILARAKKEFQARMPDVLALLNASDIEVRRNPWRKSADIAQQEVVDLQSQFKAAGYTILGGRGGRGGRTAAVSTIEVQEYVPGQLQAIPGLTEEAPAAEVPEKDLDAVGESQEEVAAAKEVTAAKGKSKK